MRAETLKSAPWRPDSPSSYGLTMSTTSLMTTSLTSPTARKLLGDLDAELMGLYPDHPYPPPFGDDEATGIGKVLIAYANRRAVGCGAVRRIDQTRAELLRMYVLPSARRQGIGSLLLGAMEAEASEIGATTMMLEAGDRQPDAIALYESRGYTRTEPWMDEPHPHSVFMQRSTG